MSGLKKRHLNFLAICNIPPTKPQLNHIINASVKMSRPGCVDSANVSYPFQTLQQILLSDMREEKTN